MVMQVPLVGEMGEGEVAGEKYVYFWWTLMQRQQQATTWEATSKYRFETWSKVFFNFLTTLISSYLQFEKAKWRKTSC